MEKIRFNRGVVLFTVFLLGTFLLSGCAGVKPKPTVSKFEFSYKDEKYQIFSILTESAGESYNSIAGNNLSALDLDQDGVIDRIVHGDTKLVDVQNIYAFGIEQLRQKNRLKIRQPTDHRFLYENSGIQYEISSFHPMNAKPFNEFKIIDKRLSLPDMNSILLDHNADGTLDEIIKGDVTLEYAQVRYTWAIEAGLDDNTLVRIDGMVLVREK